MKLYITIRDFEAYLSGDLDFSMTVFADTEIPKRLGYPVLAEVEINPLIDDTEIRQFALDEVDKDEAEIKSKLGEEIARIDARRQKLLAIEHKPEVIE